MRRLTARLLIISSALGAMACSGAAGATPSAPPAVEQTPSGPLEPLGPTTSGDVMKMPGSGFAVDIPVDWSVEVAGPDLDLAQAQPGDAWEALRAYAPDRRQTCSVYVAVATAGTAEWAVTVTPGLREPRWTGPSAEPVLEVAHPRDRVEDRSGHYSVNTSGYDMGDDPTPDHDVFWAVVCAADGEPSFDSIIDSFAVLPVEE